MILLLLLAVVSVVGHADYPEIQRLDPSDSLYLQQQHDLKGFYRWAAGDRLQAPGLTLYTYRVRDDDDLLGLSARLGLRPDTLASINGLATSSDLHVGVKVLVPSIQGLFLAETPRTILEELMLASRSQALADARSLRIQTGNDTTSMRLLPGASFAPLERAYFVRTLFRLPLRRTHLTSGFGPRASPFSGEPQFHGGVDLRAALGDPIVAAAPGTVSKGGLDTVYGVYVIIDHPDHYQTLYGHMGQALVVSGQVVPAGEQLGTVGTTGLTTGPHLHFEVRRGGRRLDPLPLTASPVLNVRKNGKEGRY